MTLMMALKKFFGLKPGETLTEFHAETKALTQADRDELKAALETHFGEPIEETRPASA